MTRLQTTAIFLFALLLIMVPGPGMAQQFVDCVFSEVTDADFGELDLSLEGPFRTTATLNIECRQGEPGETVYACLNIGAGRGGSVNNLGARNLTGPDPDRTLIYNIYQYPEFRGGGSIWGSAFAMGGRPPLIELPLDDRGRAETSRTLHFEIFTPRRQLSRPPGRYRSFFNGANVSVRSHSFLHYGYETGNNCNEALAFNVRTPFTVEASLVQPTRVLGFTKAFSPARVEQGEISRLTFTIDSANNVVDFRELAFTDAFPDGLVVAEAPNAETSCGGTFAPAASASSLAFSGGSVVADEACTIAVDVQALRAGTLESRSGDLTSDLPIATVTSGATATLTVDAAPPLSVSMAFEPPAIAQGGVSRLTHTLDNGAAIGATSVALSDRLPADMVLADPPDAQTTCTGGRLTAAAGDEAIAYSGGALAAGASCTIAVDVTSATAGSYPNETESVTSSLGTSAAVSAKLTADPAEAPGFARVFAPDSVRQGGETQIVFTVDNTANLIDLRELAFTDAFPGGLVVADAPNATTACGGTYNPVAGATALAFTGGVLAAGATCDIRVTVRAIEAGRLTGPAVTLMSNVAPATAAEARLDVTPAEAPGFAKAFLPARVDPGGISRLTFTIDNAANLIEVGSLAFTDAFPDGLVAADPPNAETSCGGTFAPAASAASLAFIGGSVAAGQTCTIALDVQARRAGTLENLSGVLASDLPITVSGARATLTVDEDPLTASMSFTPTAIAQGGVSRLTHTLDNGAAVGATSVALSDRLPADMVLADPPDAQTTCSGGRLTAAAGDEAIAYSGGALAAGASCTIAVDVTSATAGSYPNETESVTSSLGTSAAVSARLTVEAAEAPGFARVFAPDSVRQGGETQIVFTVDNGANLIDLRELAFTDAFPGGLVVADAPSATTACGGRFDPVAGATTLAFADGALAAGATCDIRVTLRAIEAGTLTVPAVTLRSNLAPATAAEARLDVTPAAAPGFAKAFSPARVAPGGISRLTFTIDNAANLIEVGSLAFTDAFPDGLVAANPLNARSSCGGAFVLAASAASLAFSGGSVAAGEVCTIAVNVQAQRAGTLENRSGALASDLPVTTPGAGATLTVDEAPLSVSMAFEPTAIAQGGVSRLTYTLDNGAAVEATSVSLSDRLPVDVALADPPDAQTTCTGGRLAAAGNRAIAYSEGALAAGASCTIAVDVTSATAGSYSNETESVTSSLGTSAAVSAGLTVEAAEAPGFARVFAPDSVRLGGETQIVFTLDNTANVIDLRELAFTDAFPDGLVVADTPNATTACGGTYNPAAGATTLAFADGALAAGATCEIRVTVRVTVRAITAGTLTVPAVTLTSNLAPATAAEARLTVEAVEVPGFAKAFSPARVDPGGISRLTFTIDNAANLIAAGALAFTDAFPDGLVAAATPNAETGCGGTFAPAASATSLAFTGGSVAAGEACTIAVDVQALRPGTLENRSDDLTSDLPFPTFIASTTAEATLTVDEDPLTASMSFTPETINEGGVSRLTYTLDNGAAVEATSVALSDTLPADVAVADPPDAQTTCAGGTLTVTAGSEAIAYSDGALAAGASCTIAVDVTSVTAGRYRNDTESVTSSLGTSAAVSATLTVDPSETTPGVTPVEAPGFAKAFSPARVEPGGISTLTFTIDNAANPIAVGSLAFTDAFPDGLVVADAPNATTACDGTFGPVAGATTLAFSGGNVTPLANCTLSVNVQARRAGMLENRSGALASDLTVASTAAEATLMVDEDPLTASMSFAPTTIDQGGVSTLTYTLSNGAAIGATSVALFDRLPANVVVAAPPNAQTTCAGGRLTAAAGDEAIAYSEGALAAGASCTIAVDVTSATAGSYSNDAESVTSSLGTSTAGSARLMVDAAGAPGFARVFAPDSVRLGGETQIVFTVDNTANAIDLRELAFTDAFPNGLVVADAPNATTACGGTYNPVAGAAALAFADGVLAAGATCEIRVTLRAIEAGTLIGPAVTLTSNLAPATAAEARLDVTPAEAPGFAKAFSPARVEPGGISTLTFTIDNAANLIAVGSLAFTDAFPDGLVTANPPNAETSCGGTFEPAASASSLAFSGGSVAADEACMIALDVQALRAGTLENLSGALASDLPVTTPGAGATLTVDEVPLSVSMAFEPPAIAQGGVSRLTYTLDNGAVIGATSVALSDRLPAGVAVAAPPDAQTTCTGGRLTAAAGDEAIAYSEGALAAGASCTIAVDVTSATAGLYPNETESVTSSLGTSAAVSAMLTVEAAEAPGFARVFAPDSVRQGGETQIVFTVDNTANAIDLGELAFTDAFPDGLVVADAPNATTACGGSFDPVAGATTLAFADGALAAGATCDIRVTLRAIEAGRLTAPAVTLRSNLAPATAAEARLDVTPAGAPGFAKAFSSARVDPGGISRLTFTIDNAANLIAVGSLAFTDAFPDGLVAADPPNGSTSCGGTFAPAASATSLAFSGGSVASGEACTIAVDLQARRAGTLENLSGALTSDLPVTASGARATLTVDEDPLSVSMAFDLPVITQGEVSRLTHTLRNGAAVEATSVSLSDRLPAGVALADPPDAQTTCSGGRLTAAAGTR